MDIRTTRSDAMAMTPDNLWANSLFDTIFDLFVYWTNVKHHVKCVRMIFDKCSSIIMLIDVICVLIIDRFKVDRNDSFEARFREDYQFLLVLDCL